MLEAVVVEEDGEAIASIEEETGIEIDACR